MKVRRMIEYEGPKEWIDNTMRMSVLGRKAPKYVCGNGCTITLIYEEIQDGKMFEKFDNPAK